MCEKQFISLRLRDICSHLFTQAAKRKSYFNMATSSYFVCAPSPVVFLFYHPSIYLFAYLGHCNRNALVILGPTESSIVDYFWKLQFVISSQVIFENNDDSSFQKEKVKELK